MMFGASKRRRVSDGSLFSPYAGRRAHFHRLLVFVFLVLPALLYVMPPKTDLEGYYGTIVKPSDPQSMSSSRLTPPGDPLTPPRDPVTPAAMQPPVLPPPPPREEPVAAPPKAPAAAPAAAPPARAPATGGKKLLPAAERDQMRFSTLFSEKHRMTLCIAPRSAVPLREMLIDSPDFVEARALPIEKRAELLGRKDFRRVAFVRNPATRLYSIYRNKIASPPKESADYYQFIAKLKGEAWVRTNDVKKTSLTFIDFLRQIKRNGVDGSEVWDPAYLICGMDTFGYDAVLFAENVGEDAKQLLAAIGVNEVPNSIRRLTEDFAAEVKSLESFLTDEAVDIVTTLQGDDYRMFGYMPSRTELLRAPKSDPQRSEFLKKLA